MAPISFYCNDPQNPILITMAPILFTPSLGMPQIPDLRCCSKSKREASMQSSLQGVAATMARSGSNFPHAKWLVDAVPPIDGV